MLCTRLYNCIYYNNMYVLLRFTGSDCPFGIFKLFLYLITWVSIITSPTYSFDKFKLYLEIIVIKSEESWNFFIKVKLEEIFEIFEQVILFDLFCNNSCFSLTTIRFIRCKVLQTRFYPIACSKILNIP
jgi:hypothetical protein